MRDVLVVTSGRADHSPMRPVIAALDARDDMLMMAWDIEGDTPDEAVRNTLQGFREAASNCLLVLGDRFELLGACLAATHARIPIAHIHGGEASFGSFDNQIRDAITKLAHIHFVAHEHARQRLLALGEEPHRIHVVGAPGLDNLVPVLSKEPRVSKKHFVLTWHPETLGDDAGLEALKTALHSFPDHEVIWTGVNNDPGADKITLSIGDVILSDEWSSYDYLVACRRAAAVIGNSSSGIIEAPYLETPTVNIGARQDGRLKGRSILDCGPDVDDIERAILRALTYDGPYDRLYGEPGASARIAGILAAAEIDLVKRWA